MNASAIDQTISASEYTFKATLEKVSNTLYRTSTPPVFHAELSFKDFETIKGSIPSEEAVFKFSLRSDVPPNFIKGKDYIVCGHFSDSGHTADAVVEYHTGILQGCKIIPAGWLIFDDNKLISPFPVVQPPPRWYNALHNLPDLTCLRTGRPALLSGSNIELTVEQVIPPETHEFYNPFGDGEFKVTVVNKTDHPTVVPALLQNNDGISWEDSIIVIDSETQKPYTLPGCCEKQDLKPSVLKPSERVSAVIKTLALPCDEYWFCGGIRVYLKFALGELLKESFFYCYAERHVKMHTEVLGKCAVNPVK